MNSVNEHDFINTVKRIAIEAVKSQRPAAVIFGTVKSINPVEIRIDNGNTVDGDFLVQTEAAKDGLSTGDKVALLQMQGGQQFLILDKVVGT